MQSGVPKKDMIYIFIQMILFILFFIPIYIAEDTDKGKAWKMAGIVLATAGTVVLFLSLMQLNKNLTPFPSPKNSGKLVQSGLYKYIRHPMYLGILLMATGISLYYSNVWKIAISCLLLILFYFKSGYEEELLSKKYPEYKKYRKNAGRFWPKL